MHWIFSWDGQHISLNDWYSASHWIKRHKQKQKWTLIFLEIMQKFKPFTVDEYTLQLEYNSRLDPSNTITMIKLFEDFLKNKNVIKDDSKKYCKGIHIMPREDFAKKHYRITLNKIK